MYKRQHESAEDRKARLARCIAVMKKVDVGKQSSFVGMKVGAPVVISWNDDEDKRLVGNVSAIEEIDAGMG